MARVGQYSSRHKQSFKLLVMSKALLTSLLYKRSFKLLVISSSGSEAQLLMISSSGCETLWSWLQAGWLEKGLDFWWFDKNWGQSIGPPFVNTTLTAGDWMVSSQAMHSFRCLTAFSDRLLA